MEFTPSKFFGLVTRVQTQRTYQGNQSQPDEHSETSWLIDMLRRLVNTLIIYKPLTDQYPPTSYSSGLYWVDREYIKRIRGSSDRTHTRVLSPSLYSLSHLHVFVEKIGRVTGFVQCADLSLSLFSFVNVPFPPMCL